MLNIKHIKATKVVLSDENFVLNLQQCSQKLSINYEE
jgi:hypothetical protein